jgi:CHAT domain-containing protein
VNSRGLREIRLLSGADTPFAPEMKMLAVASAARGYGTELRPLPDATAEAKDVGNRFLHVQLLAGDKASLSAVKHGLLRAQLFHFAGHASTATGHSGILVVSDAKREKVAIFDSSFLRGDAVPSLRLAVLSACSSEGSSDGKALDSESLAGTFVRAGVPHVVATRWDVDSASSATLMQLFYDALLRGQPVAQALANAQTTMARQAGHPYYWAAFDAFGR